MISNPTQNENSTHWNEPQRGGGFIAKEANSAPLMLWRIITLSWASRLSWICDMEGEGPKELEINLLVNQCPISVFFGHWCAIETRGNWGRCEDLIIGAMRQWTSMFSRQSHQFRQQQFVSTTPRMLGERKNSNARTLTQKTRQDVCSSSHGLKAGADGIQPRCLLSDPIQPQP